MMKIKAIKQSEWTQVTELSAKDTAYYISNPDASNITFAVFPSNEIVGDHGLCIVLGNSAISPLIHLEAGFSVYAKSTLSTGKIVILEQPSSMQVDGAMNGAVLNDGQAVKNVYLKGKNDALSEALIGSLNTAATLKLEFQEEIAEKDSEIKSLNNKINFDSVSVDRAEKSVAGSRKVIDEKIEQNAEQHRLICFLKKDLADALVANAELVAKSLEKQA